MHHRISQSEQVDHPLLQTDFGRAADELLTVLQGADRGKKGLNKGRFVLAGWSATRRSTR